MIDKTVLPHKCKLCGCELWFDDVGNRNYVYCESKIGYWYLCEDCK